MFCLCMNMFLLPVYLHAQGINFQLCRKKRAVLRVNIVILQTCVFFIACLCHFF